MAGFLNNILLEYLHKDLCKFILNTGDRKRSIKERFQIRYTIVRILQKICSLHIPPVLVIWRRVSSETRELSFYSTAPRPIFGPFPARCWGFETTGISRFEDIPPCPTPKPRRPGYLCQASHQNLSNMAGPTNRYAIVSINCESGDDTRTLITACCDFVFE